MDISEIANEIYLTNKKNGFWDEDRNIGEVLMLVVSELSEALEADRENRYADLPILENNTEAYKNDGYESDIAFKKAFEYSVKDSFEDEIADAIIRLLDLSAGFDIPIEKHVRQKLEYNKRRKRMHGKKY